MNLRNVFFALAALAVAFSHASAQNFYWSQRDLDQNAFDGPKLINAQVGDTGTVFLYYTPEGFDLFAGFLFDFSWDTPGVVQFTSAETFEFDIVVLDTVVINQRWGNAFGPAEIVEEGNGVQDFLGLNV